MPNEEKAIDVPRAAVARLMKWAQQSQQQPGQSQDYWAGYFRALEHVLEMENE